MTLLYNFRGIANENLTAELALKIGNAAAKFFPGKNIAIGSDHRVSSPMLKSALIAGLLSTGHEVTDYGIIPTPVLAYLTKIKHDGGSMVTASHNPPEWNGIKFFHEDGIVFGPREENEIKERIQKPLTYTNWNELGRVHVNNEGINLYLQDLFKWVEIGERKLKVVVDAGGGVASIIVPKMLKAMGFDVVEIYCELDPLFKGRPSEPRPENLAKLSETIKKTGADIGFAYDGDADRIVVYNERGEYVSGDLCMILLADKFVKRGSKIVVNITSFFGMRYILGDKYHIIPEKWGQTFIQRRMKKENAIFGGEPDGHYMWPGFFQSYADAIFSTAKIVEILSNTKKSFSEILSEYPSLHLIRVKSKPWEGSFPQIREDIISFMEKKTDIIYTDIDTHLLYSETDTYGLTIRQSHWDKTVRIEIEALNTKEAERIIKEAYSILKSKGIIIPSLE